jgi:hypothetical protein
MGIGHQESKTLINVNGRRAWAKIQLATSGVGVATNTASLSLGGVATLAGGTEISTSTDFSLEFGLNTPLPYVGAVAGITSTGSTTVRVVECLY